MEKSLPTWQVWLMAIRPPTLLAGIGPVILGLGFARLSALQTQEGLSIVASLSALLLALLLQTAANLVNDAKDAQKGVDAGERLGPLRVVQRGLLSQQAVRKAYSFCFGAAALIAAGLFWRNQDWLMPAVALLCALAAYAYTAGPAPLSYFALGEVVALIFFGPIAVMGTNYLHTQSIDGAVAFWGLGPGLIAAAIMAINNARDIRTDARAGKHTLATIVGEKAGRLLPLALLLLSSGLILSYALLHQKFFAGLAIVALLIVLIAKGIAPLLRGPASSLNMALKRTALFNFFYALAFAWLLWV